jgi:hypothetical protein
VAPPTRVLASLALALGLSLIPAAAQAAAPLQPGESSFWNGATVDDADVPDPSLCGAAGPCFTYDLPIVGGGHRLRVAIDTPSRTDSFEFDVIGPDGSVRASSTNDNQFNEEAFVSDPEAGGWTVRVVPKGATRTSFRLRAKLERAAAAKSGALLPNLKAVPPYELGFVAPANPANGLYPPDTVNPPADVAGVHPVSCTADEAAPSAVGGFDAHRCLRLTSGPINVGSGPYDMRFKFAEDITQGEGDISPDHGTIQRGPIEQAVHYAGGKVEMRPAGQYSFHVTHGHFHDDNVLTYELFRVTNRTTGALAPAGSGTKSGFCPADQLFGEWSAFAQEKSGTFGEGDSAAGGNCFSPTDGFIGLTAGWGDVYRWQRPGQYVEFGDNGDGLYVVRATVDRPNHVLETDDTDNSAYALARIRGEEIDLLERGQGASPWDPGKVVFDGAGPADHGPIEGRFSEDGPPACLVPKLRGRTLASARRALEPSGCRLGSVTRTKSVTRGKARRRAVVRRQSPAAGTTVPAGSRVALALGKR